jgi:hypothetical protein
MWMSLVSEKKKTMVPPSAPVKVDMKPVYNNLKEVVKELFPEVNEELDDETNDNVETEEAETEDNAAYKVCNTKGCQKKFIPETNELRCEECREFNIGLVIPCSSHGCNDYAKMSHKQLKIMKENNYKPFSKCFDCSKKKSDNDFTMVWAYDEKCHTQECDGRIQLNQSKVDFFKQPHMKMPVHCYDCIQVRKADKTTNVECECATCGDTVVMSKMQKISVEKNHLISCESCRTTMTKKCAYKTCNKPFLSKARETELKTTFRKNYREEPCCSKECFLLFTKK